MQKPLVTIGVTTFNASETVERALHSAIEQTWRPIEILVVDDCSTDGTVEIVRRLAESHGEIRVLVNDVNGGVAVSRNRILAEAGGDFVAFFDDDDASLPERIEMQLKRIVDYEGKYARGEPVICHSSRRIIYPGDHERIEHTMGLSESRRAPSGPAVARRILIGTPLEDGYGACPTCCQMARLSTYRVLGGFDANLRRSEDTDFNIRLALADGHFVGIDFPLVTQYMTISSEKMLSEEHRNLIVLMAKHRTVFDSEGQYMFCCRWIEAKQKWLEGKYLKFMVELLFLVLSHPISAARRLWLAFPNLARNRALSRFLRVDNNGMRRW